MNDISELEDSLKKEVTEHVSSSSSPLTKKKKLIYVIAFAGGIICSYPTFFPLGIVIACLFLFKKDNYKINLLGLFLIIYQIINIAAIFAMNLEMQGHWVNL